MNFKVAFPKEKNGLPLLKEVLSKGGFVKLTPDQAGINKTSDFWIKFLINFDPCTW